MPLFTIEKEFSIKVDTEELLISELKPLFFGGYGLLIEG